VKSLHECTGVDIINFGVNEAVYIEVAGVKAVRPLARIDFEGVEYQVVRHPSLLVPATVTEWLKDYEYTKEYRVPVPYEDRHPCWLDAREVWKKACDILGVKDE
jgi:hypothetical protein